MQYLMDFISGVLSVLGFSILLRAPRRTWGMSALCGGLLYVLFLRIEEFQNERTALMIVCVLSSFFSQVVAWHYKTVGAVFVSASIIMLVPGYSIFEGIYWIFKGKIEEGFEELVEAMILIVIMVIGLWLGTSLFRQGKRLLEKTGRRL